MNKNDVVFNFPATCLAAAGLQFLNLNLHMASPLLQFVVLFIIAVALGFFGSRMKTLTMCLLAKACQRPEGHSTKSAAAL